MLKNVGGGIWRFFFNPLPTLFDICASIGVLGILCIPKELYGFYFCFYSMFLLIIGMSVQNERNICFKELTILSIIALTGLFIHAFEYWSWSLAYQYLNFYLMFEGFGYVFFGCMLVSSLITKSLNIRWMYITLPIAVIPYINQSMYCGRGSIVFSISIATVIYFMLKQKKWIAFSVASLSLCALLFNLPWFAMKFECRIPVWEQLIGDILQHPFIGQGFNHLLAPDNMMISTSMDTWIFKHNDYLNIMQCLGVVVMFPILFFIKRLISVTRRSWRIIPVLSIVIVSFFQMTMFQANNALIVLCLISLMYVESERSLVCRK